MAKSQLSSSSAAPRYGATLIEAIVVALIVVVVAVIAVPRLSRGSAIEAHPAELESNLAMLRNAIRLYAAEHHGAFPNPRDFENQLTEASNLSGETAGEGAVGGDDYPFGPYLRKVAPMPMVRDGSAVEVVNANQFLPGQAIGGWYYNPADGSIRANLADHVTDRRGKQLNVY